MGDGGTCETDDLTYPESPDAGIRTYGQEGRQDQHSVLMVSRVALVYPLLPSTLDSILREEGTSSLRRQKPLDNEACPLLVYLKSLTLTATIACPLQIRQKALSSSSSCPAAWPGGKAEVLE